MSHHGDDSSRFREMISALEKHLPPEIGATGKFPRGRLNEADEGEIRIAIAADPANGVVLIDFGKPTAWIGFTPDQAIDIAELLHAKARECRGINP